MTEEELEKACKDQAWLVYSSWKGAMLVRASSRFMKWCIHRVGGRLEYAHAQQLRLAAAQDFLTLGEE